jgi:hypothetical protein
MATIELGDTILEREFESVDADGNLAIITFRLGIPYQQTETLKDAKWRCNYQITGIGLEKVYFGRGIDAIDALTTCLQLGDIFIRSYQGRRKITFFGQEDLHLVPCPVEGLSEEELEELKSIRHDPSDPFKAILDKFFGNFKPEQKPPSSDQAE